MTFQVPLGVISGPLAVRSSSYPGFLGGIRVDPFGVPYYSLPAQGIQYVGLQGPVAGAGGGDYFLREEGPVAAVGMVAGEVSFGVMGRHFSISPFRSPGVLLEPEVIAARLDQLICRQLGCPCGSYYSVLKGKAGVFVKKAAEQMRQIAEGPPQEDSPGLGNPLWSMEMMTEGEGGMVEGFSFFIGWFPFGSESFPVAKASPVRSRGEGTRRSYSGWDRI